MQIKQLQKLVKDFIAELEDFKLYDGDNYTLTFVTDIIHMLMIEEMKKKISKQRNHLMKSFSTPSCRILNKYKGKLIVSDKFRQEFIVKDGKRTLNILLIKAKNDFHTQDIESLHSIVTNPKYKHLFLPLIDVEYCEADSKEFSPTGIFVFDVTNYTRFATVYESNEEKLANLLKKTVKELSKSTLVLFNPFISAFVSSNRNSIVFHPFDIYASKHHDIHYFESRLFTDITIPLVNVFVAKYKIDIYPETFNENIIKIFKEINYGPPIFFAESDEPTDIDHTLLSQINQIITSVAYRRPEPGTININAYDPIKCVKDKLKYLAGGARGRVFINKNNPSTLVKIEALVQDEVYYNNYIESMKKLHSLNLGPKIYKHFFCSLRNDTYIIIYMENLKGYHTLMSIIRSKLPTSYKNAVIDDVYKAFDIMSKNNIVHGDLHSENIMVKKNGDINDIKFIDLSVNTDMESILNVTIRNNMNMYVSRQVLAVMKKRNLIQF